MGLGRGVTSMATRPRGEMTSSMSCQTLPWEMMGHSTHDHQGKMAADGPSHTNEKYELMSADFIVAPKFKGAVFLRGRPSCLYETRWVALQWRGAFLAAPTHKYYYDTASPDIQH